MSDKWTWNVGIVVRWVTLKNNVGPEFKMNTFKINAAGIGTEKEAEAVGMADISEIEVTTAKEATT